MFKFFVEVVYEGEISKFCQGHLEVVLLIKPKTVQLLKKSWTKYAKTKTKMFENQK